MSEVLPKSLIILKNSILEGKVPTSENLEVGELALGLFKGQESIWAKNSSGEIVNMRSPRHDLLWGDLFKKYETKREFAEDLDAGKILKTSLIFIEDTKQLWTDDVYYGSDSSWEDIENYILSQVVVLPESITSLINNYDPENEETFSHETINTAIGGKIKFIRLIRNLIRKPYIVSLMIENGTIPVSTAPKEISNKEFILKINYYEEGVYIQILIKLENDIFSITKESVDLLKITEEVNDISDRLEELENSVGIAEEIRWTNVIEL